MIKRMKICLFPFWSILIFTWLAFNAPAQAQKTAGAASSVSGKIIHIVDGDTYDILLAGNKTLRVRMEGIDAPEKGMPFYKVSKTFLKDLSLQKMVVLKQTGTDLHGRTLGFAYLQDGRELSHEMIKAGLAWHYKEHNKDKDLADLETKARNEKKGLWLDKNPLAPWEVRKMHRKGILTKEMFKNSTEK